MSRITLLILKQAWPHLQLGPALHLLAFSTFQIDELTHFQKYYFFILRKSTVSLTFCDRILAPHSSSSSSSSFFVGGGGGEKEIYTFLKWVGSVVRLVRNVAIWVSFVGRIPFAHRIVRPDWEHYECTHPRESLKRSCEVKKNVRLLVYTGTLFYTPLYKLQQWHTNVYSFVSLFFLFPQSHSNNLRFIFRSGNGRLFLVLTAQLLISRLLLPPFKNSVSWWRGETTF